MKMAASRRPCCELRLNRRSAKRPCGMSLETEIKEGSLQRGHVRYFPVAPGRVEFSIELRKLLLGSKPRIVAVELPGFLERAYIRALARLPEMSVILYSDETDQDRAIFVPVE